MMKNKIYKILQWIVFPIGLAMLLYYAFRKKTPESISFDIFAGKEKQIDYNIEASEKRIQVIDDEIKKEIESEVEKHNRIDTADSFDDVYNSVNCD